MAKYAGLLALRFANADVLPFDASAYGREIARYAEELQALEAAGPACPRLADLASLAPDLERERRRRAEGDRRAGRGRAAGLHLASATPTPGCLSLERALLDPPGIPGRPWFRHLVYAPLPSYEAETLPAIREALVEGRSRIRRPADPAPLRTVARGDRGGEERGGRARPRPAGDRPAERVSPEPRIARRAAASNG